MRAVRGKDTMESCQVDPRPGHQGGKPGNEVQGLEEDVRGPVPVRRLELIADVAVGRQRQALFRDRRSGDVAAQPFQLLAFIGPRRHPGMQAEPGDLTYPVTERFIAGRQRLQREHLATLLRAYGDAVRDRMAQQPIHRSLVHGLTGEPAIVGIPFQQSLPFQIAADSPGNPMSQLREFGARRRCHPVEPQ